MTKHVLIVGAGPGLSSSIARRFGSEGWAVTLIGRTPERLERLVADLTAAGVRATSVVGDVAEHEALCATVRRVDAAQPVDACIFQPGGTAAPLVEVMKATVENVRPNLEVLVLGGVAVGQAILPGMLERGAGSLIFVGGGSSRAALPMFGNLGMAMAGLRSYAMTLSKAVAGTGVFAAFLTVAGEIATAAPDEGLIDPSALAERVWRLAEERSPSEVLMAASGEIALRSA
jgi:NAD(P)-dependent dehydrogenase (short-subunit alcohol dehydrogenase family)